MKIILDIKPADLTVVYDALDHYMDMTTQTAYDRDSEGDGRIDSESAKTIKQIERCQTALDVATA